MVGCRDFYASFFLSDVHSFYHIIIFCSTAIVMMMMMTTMIAANHTRNSNERTGIRSERGFSILYGTLAAELGLVAR